ncbi:MAG TPA: chromosomal replication initiator protein DnaA [Candidatus Paceibacterota bacterium]
MLIDHKKLWGDALADIELNVSKANFGTWFKNTNIAKQESGIVYLNVPNTFVKEWLVNKYHKFIIKSLRDLHPEIKGVEYLISKIEEAGKGKVTTGFENPVYVDQLAMQELYINKDDNLNPRYVFESFIVGPFNELAHAAAHAVARRLGSLYNPLYIYGGTGLGKTHLTQAIGNYLKNLGGNKRVYYVTSEHFMIDYVNSVQNNRANVFKEKYRKYDVLIMDDVQFLSQKEKTQEELFHLFNNFYENNKQIIFSSDKPPKHISGIEERLRSRLEGGMIVDVNKPDFESRLAILQAKVRLGNVSISDELLGYIADVIQDNIRELEGALNSVVCQSYLKKREPSLTEVKQLIKNNIKPKKMASIKDVISIVAEFYNIAEQTLYEKTRKKEVVKPRQVIMYLLREDFSTSYPYIGQKLGGRDHTTVIHAYEKIKNDLKGNTILIKEIEQIRALLYRE